MRLVAFTSAVTSTSTPLLSRSLLCRAYLVPYKLIFTARCFCSPARRYSIIDLWCLFQCIPKVSLKWSVVKFFLVYPLFLSLSMSLFPTFPRWSCDTPLHLLHSLLENALVTVKCNPSLKHNIVFSVGCCTCCIALLVGTFEVSVLLCSYCCMFHEFLYLTRLVFF